MKLFVKKLIKKAVFDRPSILYTKMTASSSNNSSSLAFHHHHESNHTDNNSLLRNRIPIRFLILGLIVLATAIDYVTRVNINIAIVTMVKQNSSHHDVHGEVCPFSSNEVPHIQEVTTVAVKNQSSSHRMIRPEEEASRFTWSPTTQGVILGSFWWSYMAMQIPSGRMAEEFGGKTIVSISLIGSGIINLLTPLAASRSVRLMVLTRMFLGFVQGGIFPSCYSMITKWFPLSERSLGFAFMEIGATIGSVIATTMGGYLSEHGFSGGWPSVFYVSGLLALIAFTAWYSFTESSPSTYPGMPSDELIYIQGDSLTGMGMSMKGSSSMTTSLPSASSNTSSFDDNGRTSSQTISMAGTALPGKSYDTSPPFTPREQHLDQHAFEIREEATARIERISASNNILTTSGSSMTSGVKSRPFVPWREILTSPPVLAVIVSKFCGGWTYFTLLSKLPAYLHDVLHVPPTQNGLLNASLYMTTCISLLCASHVSEKLINDRVLSRTTCRKTFVTIACFGSALCLMLVPYAGCETNYVMSILILGNFFLGFNAGGDVPVAGEITTNFPATLYAIGNMFGCSTGFLAPYVVGVILESGSETEDLLFLWSKVFYISASIGIFGALIFISFGDATKQAWDNIPDDVEFCLSDQDNIHEDDDNQNLRDNNSRVRMSFQTQNRKSPYMSCN